MSADDLRRLVEEAFPPDYQKEKLTHEECVELRTNLAHFRSDDLAEKQEEAIREWLRHARTWKDMEWIQDDIDSALEYWIELRHNMPPVLLALLEE